MKIILVHGIFGNRRLFKQMVRYLEKCGHECYVPALKPADARYGIADLSKKLKAYIEQKCGAEESIAIIGFSMGCLVSRYYLQELDGYKRTQGFFAVSGPHKGSMMAYWYLGKGAVDMRPGSRFITRLSDTEHRLKDIPLFAYRTPFDLMILPSKSSLWGIATNLKTKAIMHRLMPRDGAVIHDIVKNLDNLRT